ncbi:PREDICTED: major histocompatibility complex class I-related gene protein-like [Nanorana parkeri]|uniref:major histocompatibility complex class I-related gene protein-like n=1 Tax=Nanorana parkeri TaxID=125878 RepID=UPI0008543FA8|nr:PREDICTED: major histocompatibility complex class I-related gene protein-like [Nanorana parkeri]
MDPKPESPESGVEIQRVRRLTYYVTGLKTSGKDCEGQNTYHQLQANWLTTDRRRHTTGRRSSNICMMKKYLLLASVILCLSAVIAYTEKHSHYFFITVTKSSYNYPSYYATRSIDGITLYWYDGVSEVVERRVPWFRSTYATLLDASLNQLMIQRSQESLFRIFQTYLNDTEGFHVLQRMQGCIVYVNGTIDTVCSYRYDGKPFLSFVVEKAHWIAEDSRGQHFADLFNRNKTMGEKNRDILLNTCVQHITELLSLGNCTFNRREQPIVRVTQTPITNSTSRLSCRAYGHYPKNISMTWYKNGEPVPESLMEIVTLPLPEITYLTWLSMNITLEKEDVYTCSVDHISMSSPFREDWVKLDDESVEPSSRGISNGVIIATCLAVILLVVLIVFGLVTIGKSRRH